MEEAHRGGWQEVVMLRQLRITRSLIPWCPISRAIYTAQLRCVRVGEWTPTILLSPMCSFQWLYAVVNDDEKTGGLLISNMSSCWLGCTDLCQHDCVNSRKASNFPSVLGPDWWGCSYTNCIGNCVAAVHVPKPC